MAALWGVGISNIEVLVEGREVPILDGSSKEFVEAIQCAGIETQDADRECFHLKEPVFAHTGNAAIMALPHKGFSVTYTLDYEDRALGTQTLMFNMDEDTFVREIAPARTFCLEAEAAKLRANGYGKGATYQNTLVIGQHGPVENTLRYPDECARHKVLDLIGDLSLTGWDINAQIICLRSGHELNHQLKGLLVKQKDNKYEYAGR